MKVLGLITARGGSKGIQRKNLVPFAGRPLLQWTCEAALMARELDGVVLSTDDAEMAERGREWGVGVPFLRPASLASDDTPSLAVIQHAIGAVKEHFDAVCLLQPTNPLRTAADIDAACLLFNASQADSVVSVARVPSHFHPMWSYFLGLEGELNLAIQDRVVARRQDLPPAYYREGSIYLARRETLLEGASLYGARMIPYFIAEERSGGIDTMNDLEELERKAAALE